MGARPRLDDVAARVGVSTASVSLVLRGEPGPSAETRRRVLEAAAELGYRADRAASLLARRRRHLLGVLLDVRNPFHAELVDAIHAEADRIGYEVVLSTLATGRDEERAVASLLDFRCEAMLLLGPDLPSARLAELAAQVAVVAVGRRDDAVDSVRSADDAGVAAALDHLIGLGHSDIAFVDGGRGAVAAARRRGYRAAVRRAGLTARVVPGDHTEQGGIRAGRALLAAADRPTAVVASNDRCAVGLQDALVRAGLDVPGDVSIVGYDDSTLARLVHVDLTSVDQDARAQARHAVAAAVERLDGGRTRRREVVLTPRLVVRGSTGPAAAR
ncbi:LacI family DNA-binding transcriptional regulator [Spirilliplanes yamanashiensis]|uniref:LacI family transcriptional regulator n=1 Tax=Spirilliplanes yamanashiensis TaxID=42233 RepID=A0A8J3YAX3_9ACTN|nr:LacI family DNA-binding transcriptional regulator [Spirilliplanes yamanashiensis]MDP9817593.1 DNA-binding LacI/PurR family transcriptional regulator [Spirilliplanes yamanashiensis]GIJ04403.1 LacI family transcriptional regulator [Spirilliplanes yamanashiensis]